MKNRKYFVAAITAGLLMNALTVSWAEQVQTQKDVLEHYVEKNVYDKQGNVVGTTRMQKISNEDNQGIALPDNTYIIDSEIADVTGDGIEDTINLIGHKQRKEDIFADQLRIAVKDGQSKTIRMENIEKMGGYEAKLFVGDFSGDLINDVMISAPTGGSGGIVEHAVVTFGGDVFNIIFGSKENNGVNFNGRFINGFQSELTSDSIDKKITVDNSSNKENYVRMGIYNDEGTLLREQRPYSYPFSVLEPVDIDRDGVYELKGHQRIVGAYNADPLAETETILKYQHGHWVIKQIKIASYLINNSEKPLVASYDIVRHSIKTDSAEIYYPQVENMKGMLNMGYINQDLENAAKKYLAEASPNAKVYLDYEVTRQDNDMISVVFKGHQQWEGGEYKILTSVNEDIKSRNKVSIKNIIKSDFTSRKAMTELLAEAASKNSKIKRVADFGDWMGMYLTNTDIVFYYLENDNSTEYIEIAVPLKKAQPYFSEKVQTIDGKESAS